MYIYIREQTVSIDVSHKKDIRNLRVGSISTIKVSKQDNNHLLELATVSKGYHQGWVQMHIL